MNILRCLPFVVLLAAPAHAAIVGNYYVTAPDSLPGLGGNLNVVLNGTQVVNSWGQQVPDEHAIAIVGGTVRTLTNGPTFPASGAEYTLGGTFTGTTYHYPLGMNEDMFDATSDGTSIYSWDWTNGRAYRFKADWTNPTLLFELPVGNNEDRRLGITYDATNNSLWLSGYSGASANTIENRAIDGTLLSSFTVAHGRNTALALDPNDGTLWLFNRDTFTTAPTFEQYAKDGTLLSSLIVPELIDRNILGGEFAPVPEPSTLAIWGLLGLIGFGVRGRCRLNPLLSYLDSLPD